MPTARSLVLRLAGERREAKQAEGRRRLAGRDRAVLELLAAGDERLAVGRGREEAAVLVVGEALDQVSASARASANQRGSNVAS